MQPKNRLYFCPQAVSSCPPFLNLQINLSPLNTHRTVPKQDMCGSGERREEKPNYREDFAQKQQNKKCQGKWLNNLSPPPIEVSAHFLFLFLLLIWPREAAQFMLNMREQRKHFPSNLRILEEFSLCKFQHKMT